MKFHFYNHLHIGILGGGQLGRMLLQKAADYDISSSVLDPDADAPCKFLTENFVQGSFKNFETVYQFGQKCDILTIEIEHVNTEALEKLENEGKLVIPQSRIISLVQDKGLQKIFFRTHGIPTAEFQLVDSADEWKKLNFSYPCIQKLRKGGYDGRGVMKINSEEEIAQSLQGPSVIEKLIDFKTEISVIVARNRHGDIAVYPPIEMEFNKQANLVEFLYAPSSLTEKEEQSAKEIALNVANQLGITGVLAVEMFLTNGGELLVNEIAPRPHNSGHHTIEANFSSQYDQHVRILLDLPLASTKTVMPAVMVNLLGEEGSSGPATYLGLEEVMQMEGVYVHLYGKKVTKPFRKMGHITVLSDKLEEAKEKARFIKSKIKITSENIKPGKQLLKS